MAVKARVFMTVSGLTGQVAAHVDHVKTDLTCVTHELLRDCFPNVAGKMTAV